MAFSLPSYAKVNLHLSVLGQRADGYHDIFTVFQTVSLADEILFEIAESIQFFCDDPAVPVDETNLIVKAAEALRDFNPKFGARISLKKKIPMGGGLGGGSSNAAVALVGLNRLWDLGLSLEELSEIGSRLGSDVPFFLIGGSAAGFGRGTDVKPIEETEAPHMIVVAPDVHIDTAWAYRSLNAQSLTNEESNRILRVCRSEAESADFLQSAVKNDFEQAVFAEFPVIGRVKERLTQLGANLAMMSGSGASVFAIFDKEETRQAALKALDTDVNWRKFAVAAVSRDDYREKLGI